MVCPIRGHGGCKIGRPDKYGRGWSPSVAGPPACRGPQAGWKGRPQGEQLMPRPPFPCKHFFRECQTQSSEFNAFGYVPPSPRSFPREGHASNSPSRFRWTGVLRDTCAKLVLFPCRDWLISELSFELFTWAGGRRRSSFGLVIMFKGA